jgi:hypothetical protein
MLAAKLSATIPRRIHAAAKIHSHGNFQAVNGVPAAGQNAQRMIPKSAKRLRKKITRRPKT